MTKLRVLDLFSAGQDLRADNASYREEHGTNQGGGAGRIGPVRPPLDTMARKGLWPTPRASDGERGGRGDLLASIRGYATQRAHWPTPTANRYSGLQSHGRNIILGTLSPKWVAWLMGFPIEWLSPSSKPSETPSSLKSRNSLAARSSKRKG